MTNLTNLTNLPLMARPHEARVRLDGKDTGEGATADWPSELWRPRSLETALVTAPDTDGGWLPDRSDACGPRAGAVRVLSWRGGGGAWRAPFGGQPVGKLLSRRRGVEGDGEA